MKREEILAMKPGEQLDRVVALKVMGYEESKMRGGWVRMGALATYPKRYSSDISAAWEVVEKLKSRFTILVFTDDNGKYAAEIDYNVLVDDRDTAPEAICKASLLAVLEEGQP